MIDLTLNGGRTMPALGMGTWQVPDSQAAMVVRQGLDAGFRLVDTAASYDNERGVGEGVKASGAFVTTKLWNGRHRDAEAALDESLALLGLDAVDLYLIHWPQPGRGDMVAAWRELVAAREAGKAKSIGVSNFLPEHVDAIVGATGVPPAVNQIELHPRFQQRTVQAYHRDHGIVTQSWSPLGKGDVLGDPVVTGVAERLGRSAAEVVIAWHLAKGLSVIPKASSPEHLRENAAAEGLTLSKEDVLAIDALDDPEGRTGPDPLRF